MPSLQDRLAAASAPGDEVVKAASIHGLPTLVQSRVDLGSQLGGQDGTSCGSDERMCKPASRKGGRFTPAATRLWMSDQFPTVRITPRTMPSNLKSDPERTWIGS